MLAKGNERRFSAPGRRKSSLKPSPGQRAASNSRHGQVETKLLHLVRAGVEDFILKNATVEDFLSTMRAATEKEKVYSHQLTRSVFAKIVKEAIRKRNLDKPQ